MVDNNRKWDLEPESVTEIARNLEDVPVGNFALRLLGVQAGGQLASDPGRWAWAAG